MKFSIRDLLLVTVIVALALGWWVDHRRQVMNSRQSQSAKREAESRCESLRDLVERDGSKVVWIRSDYDGRVLFATVIPPSPKDSDDLPNSSAPAPKLPSD